MKDDIIALASNIYIRASTSDICWWIALYRHDLQSISLEVLIDVDFSPLRLKHISINYFELLKLLFTPIHSFISYISYFEAGNSEWISAVK